MKVLILFLGLIIPGFSLAHVGNHNSFELFMHGHIGANVILLFFITAIIMTSLYLVYRKD
jgi:ABC-type Fe3+-siderophore transport system permease subunit